MYSAEIDIVEYEINNLNVIHHAATPKKTLTLNHNLQGQRIFTFKEMHKG